MGSNSNSMGNNRFDCNYFLTVDRKLGNITRCDAWNVFTSDRLIEKVDEMSLNLHSLLDADVLRNLIPILKFLRSFMLKIW